MSKLYPDINKEMTQLLMKELGNDLIGSTITNIYIHSVGIPQSYGSYDSGEYFVIEYKTVDGTEKCCSIIDSIHNDNSPVPNLAFLDHKTTLHVLNNNCGCDECEELQKESEEFQKQFVDNEDETNQ